MCGLLRKSACLFGQVETKMYLPEGHFFKISLAGASRQVLMSDPAVCCVFAGDWHLKMLAPQLYVVSGKLYHGLTILGNYLIDRSIFGIIFEGELFIRSKSTTLLQIFGEFLQYFKIIFSISKDPDNTFVGKTPGTYRTHSSISVKPSIRSPLISRAGCSSLWICGGCLHG